MKCEYHTYKSPEGFSKSFFKVSFIEKFKKNMFWGSFRGVKTYSEQKLKTTENIHIRDQ